ncbi:MAG: hypothetical protein WCA35_06335, partial [Kovacikia sp.]
MFSQVDQAIEIYRAIASSKNEFEALGSTFFVGILTIFIWYTSRLLEVRYQDRDPDFYDAALKKYRLDIEIAKLFGEKTPSIYKTIPRFLGVIPLLGLCLGIYFAHSSLINDKATFLWIWLGLSSVFVGLIYYSFVKRVVF